MNLKEIDPLELNEKEALGLYEFLIQQPKEVIQNFLTDFLDHHIRSYSDDDLNDEQNNKPFMKLFIKHTVDNSVINEWFNEIVAETRVAKYKESDETKFIKQYNLKEGRDIIKREGVKLSDKVTLIDNEFSNKYEKFKRKIGEILTVNIIDNNIAVLLDNDGKIDVYPLGILKKV